MDYGQAEEEIVARLNSWFVSKGVSNLFEAIAFPETEADAKAFIQNFSKTRVAVQFNDSTPQPSQSIGSVSQEETIRFRLSYEARKLRGEGGLYQMFQLTKEALIGYRLTNTTKLTFAKYGMLEFEQNSWQPFFEFECKTTNVQAFEDFEDDTAIGGNVEVVLYNSIINDPFAPQTFGPELDKTQFQ